jgi:uncharacterized protein
MDDSPNSRTLFLWLCAIGISPFLLNGWINSVVYDIPVLYWGFEFLSWVLLPAVIVVIAIRHGGLRWRDVGLTGTIAGENSVTRIVLTAFVLCPLAWLYFRWTRYFAQQLFPDPGFFTYVLQVLQEGGLPRPLMAAYFALSAGIVEELYFRGLMFRISQCYSHPLAIYTAVSPALFALVHWENGVDDMLYTWLIGLLFALLYARWRNLWPLIAAHVFIDYVNFS